MPLISRRSRMLLQLFPKIFLVLLVSPPCPPFVSFFLFLPCCWPLLLSSQYTDKNHFADEAEAAATEIFKADRAITNQLTRDTINKASQNARIMSKLSVSPTLTPHSSSFLLALPPVLCVPKGLGWLNGCVCLCARHFLPKQLSLSFALMRLPCAHMLLHAAFVVAGERGASMPGLATDKPTTPPSLLPPPVYCVDPRSWSLSIEFLRQVPRSKKAEPDTAQHCFGGSPQPYWRVWMCQNLKRSFAKASHTVVN